MIPPDTPVPAAAGGRHPIFCIWRFTFFLLLLTAPAGLWAQTSAAETGPVTLTAQEREWLATHTARVGVIPAERLPFENWHDDHAEGMAPDYLRLLAGKVGLKLDFVPFTEWRGSGPAHARAQARFDILMTQALTPQVNARFHTLSPFTALRPALVVRKRNVLLLADKQLTGRRIGATLQHGIAGKVGGYFPKATVVPIATDTEGIDAVAQENVDLYVLLSRSRGQWLLRQRSDAGELSLIPLQVPAADVGPVVNRQQPMLHQILRKAETLVSPDEMAQLRARWNVAEDTLPATAPIELSAEERIRLANEPPLRMAFEARRFPYSFVNENGELDGLVGDYVERLRGSLGLRIEPVPAHDWYELEQMVRSGEVDMAVASVGGDLDGRIMRVSRPYDTFPEVIVSRIGTDIDGREDLAGKRVAVRDESGLLAQLRTLLPSTRLIPVGSNEDGLAQVDQRAVDAFIGTLPAIDPLIRERFAGRLQVVGPVGVERGLAFGVSDARANLLPLINRALDSVGDRERQSIRARWLTTEYRYGADWAWLLATIAGGLLIIGTLGFLYLGMRREARARRAAEAKLQTQLRFQQLLLESIPYPVFVKDSQGRYVAVNPAYEESYAVRAEDLLGRTMQQTHHVFSQDLAAVHAMEMQVVATQTRLSREVRAHLPSGEQRALLWLGGIPLEQDDSGGLLGVIVDVTEIRLAEERARAAEQRLADISASLPAAVFQIRADPQGRWRFTYAAGDTEGTFGMSVEDLMADASVAFNKVHPDDQPFLLAQHAKVMEEMRPVTQFDMRMSTATGERWRRTAGGAPRRDRDGSVEWSGYLIDVDDVHQQALALSDAKRKAEAASAAKSAFLAMMSHEIRTPMAGVIGLIELMQETDTDAEQAEMLEMMQGSAASLRQILDDILDYSRIESGQLSLEKAAVDMRHVVDSVVGLFAGNAWNKDLAVYVDVDWRIAPLLEGDPTRLRQVISNLLSNAIKFTERGHVTVQVELLEESAGRQLLRVRVQDTGIGISEERLKEVFQPFVQAEASTARRFGGTGLGLSICHKLATMMGAALHLRAREEGGTEAVLEIELPLSAREPGTRRASVFGGKHALLVVKDAAVRRGLANGLSALGFNVGEQDSRHDAIGLDSDGLLVIDAADGGADPAPHRILISDTPDLRGYYLAPEGVVLRGNALLHASLLAACRAAYHLPEPVADTAQDQRKDVYANVRLLVAEDNPANRIVIARQLKRLGIPHWLVEDGREAMEALQQQHFDLLITDCHMPRMDGFELTRLLRARERERGGHLPIIALTASTMPEEVARCLASGMDDVIAKPVQLAKLEAKIGQALTGSRDPVAAAPSRASASPSAGAAAAVELRLDMLLEAFGDEAHVRAMLDALRMDIANGADALEQALRDGDEAQARELRHRMMGTLSLLLQASPASDSITPAQLRERVRQIEALRRRLE